MDLRYPVGKFDWQAPVAPEMRPGLIAELAAAPDVFRQAVAGLNDAQLDTPYRPDGWTVRQVVHHVADSHMNSYIRLRLALTEDEPTIKPYLEAKWAELHDARTAPVAISLQLIDTLHQRWVDLLASMTDSDFARVFRHPERGLMRLDTNLALYAWHSRHHAAHITSLRARMGWDTAQRAAL
jgi:DinB superfamily